MIGKRTLIVEDDYYVAHSLKTDIEAAGGVAVGPFATVIEALQALHDGLDAAILDVEVIDGFTYPLAAKLRAQNIPVIFATGVRPQDAPKELQSCLWLPKPYVPGQIVQLIRTIVNQSTSSDDCKRPT